MKEFIQNLLSLMTSDKVLHFLVCYFLTTLGISLVGDWSIVGVVMIAIGKEIYDIKTTGFSWRDLIADSLGIAAGIIVSHI